MHTHVKLNIKWGNPYEFFSIFIKKGVRGNEPNGRMVQPTQLIRGSIEAEFRALKTTESFFFHFHFSYRVLHFFLQKNAFLPKKLTFQTV